MRSGHEYQVIDDMAPSRRVVGSERDAVRAAARLLARADRHGARVYMLQSSVAPGERVEGGSAEVLEVVRRQLQQNRHRSSTHHVRNLDGPPVRVTVTHIPDGSR